MALHCTFTPASYLYQRKGLPTSHPGAYQPTEMTYTDTRFLRLESDSGVTKSIIQPDDRMVAYYSGSLGPEGSRLYSKRGSDHLFEFII